LLYLAIIGAGGIFTGSNPGYTSLELNHHITTSHAKYIIGEPNFLNTILETAKECNIAKSKIFMFDAVDKASYGGLRSWDSLLQHGEEDWIHFDDAQKQRNTVASLGFTSGSTGLPKAAMIPHSYAVSQTSALQSRGKPYKVKHRDLRLITRRITLTVLLGSQTAMLTSFSCIPPASNYRMRIPRTPASIFDA